MKNIIKSTLLMLAAGLMFTACSDDNDSNPTLLKPSTFALNTPAYANQVIDLGSSSTVNFTWSQPDYGFPVAAEYQLQVSKDGNFTTSYAQEVADDSGATVANYVDLEQFFTSCTGEIDAEAFNKALNQLFKWEEGDVPEQVKAYVRASAVTAGASKIYSNVVEVLVAPYYVELKDAAPVLWYLVGSCIGNGSWGNTGDGDIGNSLIPLLPSPEATFDANGNGILLYAGYFPAGGQFKFIKVPGSWNEQLNFTNVDSPDASIVRDEDGDNHNVGIVKEGYYKITLNTVDGKVTVEPYDGTVRTFTTMNLPGEYQGWDPSAGPLTAVQGA